MIETCDCQDVKDDDDCGRYGCSSSKCFKDVLCKVGFQSEPDRRNICLLNFGPFELSESIFFQKNERRFIPFSRFQQD